MSERATVAGRPRILAAALGVFAERGYEGASIAAIASRAGVAKSVLYHHFGSKAALYAAILDHETEDLVDAVRAALPADERSPRLRAGLDAYLGFLERRREVWDLFVRDPPLDADARAAYERNRGLRSEAIASAIAPLAEPERPGKQAYVELLVTAARTFTAWWHQHPEVPRERILDAIMAFAAAGAEHVLGD